VPAFLASLIGLTLIPWKKIEVYIANLVDPTFAQQGGIFESMQLTNTLVTDLAKVIFEEDSLASTRGGRCDKQFWAGLVTTFAGMKLGKRFLNQRLWSAEGSVFRSTDA
jgi:hypothetical protein